MIGQLLDGRYRVVRALGSGGFGQTFVAEDTRRPGDPACVVKLLKPASTDPEFLQVARRLFQQEAESLETLGHHDHIPRLLAFFEHDQQFYLVQDLVEGTPLSNELTLGQRWTEAEVIGLLKEVLEILTFIHQRHVIHRDIKPDNLIRRDSDRKLVLVDFGAVKQVSNQTLLTGGRMNPTVAVGTPGYMASEQSQGQPRPCSDLYALGVIAIQALTGLSPTQLHQDPDGELIWRDQAQVSDGLAAVITRMVYYYFKMRYQSATEVLQALNQLESRSIPQERNLTATESSLGEYSSYVGSLSTLPTQAVLPQPQVSAPVSRPQMSSTVSKVTPSGPGFPIWAGLGALAAGVMVAVVAVSYLGPGFLTQLPASTSESPTPDVGRSILDSAKQEAISSGNLERAIALAQDVPNTSPTAAEAQQLIRTWQQDWQAQNQLFQDAQRAFEQERWYEARELSFKLPRNPYWNRRANPIYFQSLRKIKAIEAPPPPPPLPPEPPPETPEPTETLEPTDSPSPSGTPTVESTESPTLPPSPTPEPPNVEFFN
jgi:serine/threonine-protein kinase